VRGRNGAEHRRDVSGYVLEGPEYLTIFDRRTGAALATTGYIPHDGKGLYSTGWGDGDALHVSDLDPDRPGLEVFNIQERFDDAGAIVVAGGRR
jgi:hypothetical protein